MTPPNKRSLYMAFRIVVTVAAIVSAIVLCIFPFLGGAAVALSDFIEDLSWRSKTEPLPAQVIEDLCQKLDIGQEKICTKSIVLGPDFFPYIVRLLETDDYNLMMVDEILGPYKLGCESISTLADGTRYFVCKYDISGDHIFPISIFYHADETVWRIVASTSN